MNRVVARSMRQALLAQPSKVQVLDLSKSDDLMCNNIMCEKVGDPCVCKLARFIQQNQWHGLEEINLKGNTLSALPDAIFLPGIKVLNLSDNTLTSLSDSINQCQQLNALDLSGNNFSTLPWAALEQLPGLKTVLLLNNKRQLEVPNVFKAIVRL